MDQAPLAPGSISLRLYAASLGAEAIIDELQAQAAAGSRAGFDGVMFAEHHGGFASYLPNPIQLAGFALDAMETGWAAACPILLPLRHWSQTAEDLAWLAARHPGRVGAGFGVGGLAQDFEMADLDWSARFRLYIDALPKIVAALRGEAAEPLGRDAALARCKAHPIPIVVAAQVRPAVERAAKLGIGLLYDSLQTTEHLAMLSRLHAEAGGPATRILIRRVWLGPAPGEASKSQLAFYKSYTNEKTQSSWGGEGLVAGEGPGRAPRGRRPADGLTGAQPAPPPGRRRARRDPRADRPPRPRDAPASARAARCGERLIAARAAQLPVIAFVNCAMSK
jgi:alkanesulfonate monooxygenase SsuD/methylene tetrahydromethanopterin reductase-like flavin-dependent oxidoreductase (luciferase family)